LAQSNKTADLADGCNGGVRQELAAGIGPRCHWRGRWRVRSPFGATE